jgi:hypothetical protein
MIIELPETVHGQTHLRVDSIVVRGQLGTEERDGFEEAPALRRYRLDLSPTDALGEVIASALDTATADGEHRERLMDGVSGRTRTREVEDEVEPEPEPGEER